MRPSDWRRPLAALASLRLTVALFAMAMVLVFAGTLAQVERGVWDVVDRYFRSCVAWIDLRLFVPGATASSLPWAFPFPGGFLIGAALVANLVAAHARRFSLAPRRLGVLLLHAGVVVLLVGELVTALLADEGTMSIDEGASADYVEDIRSCELAIVDGAHADHDRVTAVPGALLAHGGVLRDERLPFDVEVLRWLPNSRLRPGSTGDPAPASGWSVDEVPVVRGVDAGAVDAPSAELALSRDGRRLGSWLVSTHLVQPQRVEVEGRAYAIALRFRRTYRPYRIHLVDFRHDTFVGTDRPRNFSSRVRLVDAGRGVDREAVIAMNQPLRHAGETFYQAAYKPDDSGTILQVVRNPGWLMPYAGCALVAAGMALQLGLAAVRSLRREGA